MIKPAKESLQQFPHCTCLATQQTESQAGALAPWAGRRRI